MQKIQQEKKMSHTADWHRGLNPFWPHKFGFKPLLGLEPMAPIRPQLPFSHANHSATEISRYIMCVCVCVCVFLEFSLFSTPPVTDMSIIGVL